MWLSRIPRRVRKERKALTAGLKDAKYSVEKFGHYGRSVDSRQVLYMQDGHRRLAGEIVATSQGLVLLSYPSPRTEEMEAVAQSLHCRIVRDETPFRAVESYLRELAAGGTA